MEEIRTKHISIHSAAYNMGLDCISPQIKESAYSSPYHVHPYPSPVRLQHAFQANQGSPKMFYPKGLKTHDVRAYGTPNESPILGRALCLTPRSSPTPGRVSHLSEKFQDSLTVSSDTDALVSKISAMFPTVSETHIKILLKKYYNREAVVISALQVEKHPIATPGPLTMSPSANRLQKAATGVYSALQMSKGVSGSVQGSFHFTPLTGTPHGSPSLLRPASGASSYYGTAKSIDGQTARHHSPKLKLKYLKSIFPQAEETLILDVLANHDNNVQRASEDLQQKGFTKKEMSITNRERKVPKETTQQPKKVVTIKKTVEEKNNLKQKLQLKYKSIPERVISIALESVDYNEDRAIHILGAVDQTDSTYVEKKTVERKETNRTVSNEVKYIVPSPSGEERQLSPADAAPATRRLKSWTEHLKPILKSSSGSEVKHKSIYTTSTSGPDPTLRKGPQESLLLLEYMAWNGPDPKLRIKRLAKPEGPEKGKDREKSPTLSRGPAGLAKGPTGLAKGSIYQKFNKKSAKITI